MDDKPIKGSDNPSGKLGSEQPNGAREPINATVRIQGAIDPALARTTAGAGRVNGSVASAPSGNTTGDPASGSLAPEPKRKPGRPPGPAKPKPETDTPRSVNVSGVEKILLSVHAVVAATLSVPELALEEKEAKELSAAIAAVSEQYLIVLAPKTAAWIELSKVLGVVYGPRAVSIWLRTQDTKKKAPPIPQTAPVIERDNFGYPVGFDPTKITMN
jgi:hypothetical protein